MKTTRTTNQETTMTKIEQLKAQAKSIMALQHNAARMSQSAGPKNRAKLAAQFGALEDELLKVYAQIDALTK